MKFKFLKSFLGVTLVFSIFLLNVCASDLFFEVEVDGLCTVVKIYNDKHKSIWSDFYLTRHLCTHPSKINSIDPMKLLDHLKSIGFKRINKKVYPKLRSYIRLLNRIKKKYADDDFEYTASDDYKIRRYNCLIFITALRNWLEI